MFDNITFMHFFMETKRTIKPEHYAFLNPYRQMYFKYESVYLALVIENNIISIEYAQNDGKQVDWLTPLRDVAIEQKNKSIVFQTSINNLAVNSLAKKWKCNQIGIKKNYYSTGEDCILYEYIIPS